MVEIQRSTVLVVDDDVRVRTLARAMLEAQFRVVEATDGVQALRQVYLERPDLVLLDVTMPAMDGMEACRRIRDLADVPIIMVTGRDSAQDAAGSLDAGADDYVRKPYRPVELLARIRALLRRRHVALLSAAPAPDRDLLTFDDGRLVVDTRRRLAVVDGQDRVLSATEYKMLELLARNAGHVLSPAQILEHVWGPEYVDQVGYVKTYVGLLRGKVEPDPHQPIFIRARRGLGYYLERRAGAPA